jgi:hypothetical protein
MDFYDLNHLLRPVLKVQFRDDHNSDRLNLNPISGHLVTVCQCFLRKILLGKRFVIIVTLSASAQLALNLLPDQSNLPLQSRDALSDYSSLLHHPENHAHRFFA